MNIEPKFKVGSIVYTKFTGLCVKIKSIVVTVNNVGVYISYKCNKAELDRADSPAAISCYPDLEYEEDELTEECPKQKPKSIYDLKYGDTYYLLNNLGSVQSLFFDGCSYDKKAIAQGNAFLTSEEAEKEAKRKEIHQELKKLAGGCKFRKGKLNYYIVYYYQNGYVKTTTSSDSYCPGIVYFPTYEAVENAIRIVGEECLIQDYFGMEEENDQN